MPRLLCFIQYHWASWALGTLVSRYSFVDSREGASELVQWLSGALQTRSSLLARVPLSRLMILVWPREQVRWFSRGCHCTRTSTLETMLSPLVLVRWLSSSTSLFHLRLLRCAGTVCIVQGVHHLRLLIVQVWSLYTVLLGAFVVCICKWHCVCRCTWW